MSCKIPIESIQEGDVESFEKNLMIEEKTKQMDKKLKRCPWLMAPKFNTVRRENDHLFLPFYWANSYFDKKYRTERQDCCPIKIQFKGRLREDQQLIMRDTIYHLNKSGSCTMGVYPGFGKCLGKGTRILLIDGSYKNVEKIKIGDQLVDENYEPTAVVSITRGKELMYKVAHESIPEINFVCNKSHILTLWDTVDFELVDMSLHDFIHCVEKKRYVGIYQDFDAKHFNLTLNRSSIVQTCKNNKISFSQSNLRMLMLSGLVIEKIENDEILFSDPFLVLKMPERRIMITFPIVIQELVIDDYYGFQLDKSKRFMLWDGIITHNTIVSLSIASQIGLRTFIIVNKIILVDQWIETIRKVFGDHARIQSINSKSKIENGCQFYIMNAINVPKRNTDTFEQMKIGFVIVDECHLILTRIFSRALSYLCPRYLLGLSATPFRPDGFDSLFNLYFGIKKVVKRLNKKHTVHLVESKIKITPKKDKRGETIWNSVIDEQATNEHRNNIIVHFCNRYKDRNILILSKRIAQIERLHDLLKNNDHVCILKDNETKFDKEARVLIATFQKVGTGFSHDKLNMLILATDAEEYFIQYLGRVFRRPDTEPIIIDIVDDNPILKKHFLTRKKVYQDAGGIIFNDPFSNVQNIDG
jgi:hypothetical protein